MELIHEFSFDEMPKRRMLELLKRGARLYKICENRACVRSEDYQPILSDRELMTYCLQCGRKVLRFGVELPGCDR